MSEDTPAPAEHGGSGEGGGFLSTTRGIVTGLTSLVVAVTGLVVACEKLAPADPAAPQAAVSTDGEPAAAADDAAATTGEDTGPLLYTGEDTRLEWDADANHWLLTLGDSAAGYEDINPDRPEDTMARMVGGDHYLRWPTDGGWLEVSEDGKQSWSRVARIAPEQPEQQPDGAEPEAGT